MVVGSVGEDLVKDAGLKVVIEKMVFLEDLMVVEIELINSVVFLVGNDIFYLEFNQEVDVEVEIVILEKDLVYYEGFVVSVEKKFLNECFVNNVLVLVVECEC